MSVFIIAEAGVNHNGSIELAYKLIDVASASGVNAVKFQTFKTENLVIKNAPKIAYQEKQNTFKESQFDMLQKLELSWDDFRKLFNYANSKKIKFMSTAFDSISLNFLINDLGLNLLKIPSGEITNRPFLLEHAKSKCDIILSTGMSSIQEIEEALGVLAFGLLSDEVPTKEKIKNLYDTEECKKTLKEKITLMHCTTQYPASPIYINLNAIKNMENIFGLRIGYSDHSEGIFIPNNAVALGAKVIEKHFTIDRTLPGPDHKASLNPKELKDMIKNIRITETSLGNGEKVPQTSELQIRDSVRKSIYAKNIIEKGDILSSDNLAIKRPGNGRSPMDYWELIGESSDNDYLPEEKIK